MFFKNARIYDLKITNELLKFFKDPKLLENALFDKRFKPCGPNEAASIGFSPIFGKASDLFSFSFGPHFFFKITEENKLLPKSVINSALEDEIEKKEIALDRKLSSDEIKSLSIAIGAKLLQSAFCQRRDVYIWVDTNAQTCTVGASSAKKAERAIAMFREAFNTFPTTAFQPRCIVEDKITSWLTDNNCPDIFELGNDSVLKSTKDDGGVIRASKENLQSDEIALHIENGKRVNEIQLIFDNSVAFVINTEFALKRIKLTDNYIEKNLSDNLDDKINEIQSHFILQSDIFSKLIANIKEIFNCD